ncbi:hypothetical protein HPB48_025738 [Haemaphysalis longicornis]|uniref:Transposable element n=1 Tax=Haemaphysalis longicornis TaxID=44386 RepID=A0A9J6H9C0_HAELO|nr:hypothetical protein HPB48_025738 [Haemaphysalis longicornis]
MAASKLGDFEAGFRDQDIADATGHGRSSINRIVRAYETEGRLENLHRGRRQRATNDSDDERIVAATRLDPKLIAKARNRVAAQKPLFSAQNRSGRLLFAREHQTWTAEEWRSVIFTDESTFTTRFDQQQRVWRTENTRFDASNIQRVASSGRCGVSVWGAISKDGLGPLVRLQGRFNAATYKDLLDTVMLPFDASNIQRVASSGRCGVSVWGAISKDGLGPLVRLQGRFNAATYKDLLDTVMLPYAQDVRSPP